MILRSLIAVALALLLALTSQSMAVARGASAATGQMVLCTGAGPVAVFTDAAGNPTSAPHICPDSALNLVVSLEIQGFSVAGRFFLSSAPVPRDAPAFDTEKRYTPPTRAPPALV